MYYYDKNNNKFYVDDFEFFNEGVCAKVFKKDDILFKVYKFDCKYRFYLSKKMFNAIKNLNINSMVKLLDYYYSYKTLFLPMDAYSMKLVDGKDIKLIYADKEYVKDIAKCLEETIRILTDNKIIMFDCHYKNILFKENGVTIIDPDQFGFYKLLTKKKIYEKNKLMCIKYITDTIKHEVDDKTLCNYLYSLRYSEDTLEDSITSCVTEGNIHDSLMLKK